MKSNFVWPAMWWGAFNSNDPKNTQLADDMGIVMGTSHHEPMNVPMPNGNHLAAKNGIMRKTRNNCVSSGRRALNVPKTLKQL